ncbi:MAG: prolipoprotein diacylglyceryl transferase [Clostridia bacterium]|nr:prolipoprotein diacylglyceryl transferase [Clostridia bacterium]
MTAYNITLFGIRFHINPIAFTLPIGSGWDIYWYGIIIATGFLLAILYGYKKAKDYSINTDRMTDIILITTPLALLCARIYYIIFDGTPISSIKDFFGFGSSSGVSGIAIYGGVIGAIVFGTLASKLRKVNVLDMYDLSLTAFLIGQGIGRWGNFVNQEAYGTFTGSSFWGMQSERTIAEMGEGLVHPCFLYESIWCIAGFFVLNYISKHRKFSGQIALCYGIWYGFGRGFIELLRTDSLMLGNIKVSSLLSFVVCIACAAIMVKILKKQNDNKKEKDSDYKNVFSEVKSEEGETDEQTD